MRAYSVWKEKTGAVYEISVIERLLECVDSISDSVSDSVSGLIRPADV